MHAIMLFASSGTMITKNKKQGSKPGWSGDGRCQDVHGRRVMYSPLTTCPSFSKHVACDGISSNSM